jgi:PncC family amidohydrolase
VAESCTGGLIAHRVTNVPGSSAYFRGGVGAYSNDVKERLLGVSRETLARHGA